MTQRFVTDSMPDITIPNNGTDSNIITAAVLQDADYFTLYGPGTLDADTFTIQVAKEQNATAASTWYTLNNNATDVTAPAVNKAVSYIYGGWGSMKIHSSGAVAADRTWKASRTFLA